MRLAERNDVWQSMVAGTLHTADQFSSTVVWDVHVEDICSSYKKRT